MLSLLIYVIVAQVIRIPIVKPQWGLDFFKSMHGGLQNALFCPTRRWLLAKHYASETNVYNHPMFVDHFCSTAHNLAGFPIVATCRIRHPHVLQV